MRFLWIQRTLVFIIYATGQDDNGILESLVSYMYFTKEQLSSGDYGKCAPGITDVSAFLLKWYYTV